VKTMVKYLLMCGMVAALVVLGGPLACSRVARNNELSAPTGTNTVRSNARQSVRGQILDIHGNPLKEADLSGVAAWQRSEMVANRDRDAEAREGLNVVLTLDAGLQNIVKSELSAAMAKHSPISASCIIVRPGTGEILAISTLPYFDPNQTAHSSANAVSNRVISDAEEPGSAFKVVVVTATLNEHLASLNDVLDPENRQFGFPGRVMHAQDPLGQLMVENIMTKSSGIGKTRIGVLLGNERLHEYIEKFGFGTPTGISLPGEVGGTVPPIERWRKFSITQISSGHGLTVTPLQLVMAMSAIANKGLLMRPMLVDRLEGPNGKIALKYKPRQVRQVATPETIREMVTALKTVITPEGPGMQASLKHYTVAGKTGTAQKVEHGQYVHKYLSSFIGFFPADNPELCIAVVMDEPKDSYYGGLVAAPVFHTIAERAARYLNLKPDIEPKP
jgi:cell division protein FtsI/penicillin-binding protein 2